MTRFNPPYLGAAYYPEDWPLEQIDEDIALMKDAGMNVMRIAEFAWSRMEPYEERYEFDWLHTAVDKLGAAGIATIMCTPTCTPPAWLTERYPEVLVVLTDGTRFGHGYRRHACPNSPIYRDHCARIVARLAGEFRDDENVIGWQIDNELSPVCACPVCHREFQDAMRRRFGSIDRLNEGWGTHLWSQTYQSFAQLPVPDDARSHHPSLTTAFRGFQSDSFVEFAERQADILHGLTDQPVGTDMMPTNALDYPKTHEALDVVQFNHYNTEEHFYQPVFWFDYCRTLKDRPFWCTETSTCWNGGVAANGYRAPGFCRANSWLPIALGGEANLYWLWRSHWSGQELMHGSVVSSCGRPLHIIDEVKGVAAGFALAADFINGTRPAQSGLAMHFSGLAWLMFGVQPMVRGFHYGEKILREFHHPLIRGQFRPDVIEPGAALDPYCVICSPFLPALDEGGLCERIVPWVEGGGTWIVGPMSDIRTLDATKYTHAPFGSIEEWAGVHCKYQIPGEPTDFALEWADGRRSIGSVWYDRFDLRGAEALATYADGPLAGLSAVTRHAVGRGSIVLLGTLPRADELRELVRNVGLGADVVPVAEASANLLVVPRNGDAGEGIVAVELENRPASLSLERPATDLLTGEARSERMDMPPYGVAVLRY